MLLMSMCVLLSPSEARATCVEAGSKSFFANRSCPVLIQKGARAQKGF